LTGLVAVAAALSGSAVATTAAGGVMTPAIGDHPRYVVAGKLTGRRAHLDPAVTYTCQTSAPAGCYGPAQIRNAYGVAALASRYGLNGAGRTIVIIDSFQSPTIRGDLGQFDRQFGLPDPQFNIIAPNGLTPFNPGDADQVSWSGEISLDVEWAHAIAPAAAIDLVLARSDRDADIFAAQQYAVSRGLGDVVSQSFGEAEQCMNSGIQAQTHQLFQQASAMGMTVFASTGDTGAGEPTCNGSGYLKAISTPASDPNVTAVGGSRLFADGGSGLYQSETAWDEPQYNLAGGGGYSTIYHTPGYQAGLSLPMRGVPDVAYNASMDGGVLTVWSSSGQGPNMVFRFAGTSAGSPQWAGLAALADQMAGRRLGAINTQLYQLTPEVHDITAGDNTYHGRTATVNGYVARPGWDPATGLGSPRADVLVPQLAQGGGGWGW
jgi:subtilase family serine protease